MFTGIIQDIGVILFKESFHNSLRLSIKTKLNKSYLGIGSSIACNGCCLTIVEVYSEQDSHIFLVDIGIESIKLTNFTLLQVGSCVNLEPALRIGDSLGGHQLTGHIDCMCVIEEFNKINNQDGDFWKLMIRIPSKFTKWVIPKGSIAIAGISLTIAQILPGDHEDKFIEIMIIPHTFRYTNLQFFAAKMCIEVEYDQSVKAIASVLETMLPNYIQARK
ncbi:riboflavin synthase [Spirobacillus cienkowskii]|uniref:riboflavin synthase n=1 Tax=Spirobacillus cienkowskii TaxID=495820 RepID=UPI0030D09DEC